MDDPDGGILDDSVMDDEVSDGESCFESSPEIAPVCTLFCKKVLSQSV